jgi:hypothetical protein
MSAVESISSISQTRCRSRFAPPKTLSSERLAHECRFKPKLAQFFIERRVRGIENPWLPVVLTRMARLDSMAHVVPEPIA